MARDRDRRTRRDEPVGSDRRIDNSTARAFAAALSALAISSLVVTSSSKALQPKGTLASNYIQSGTISLTDDDQNRSLVELTDMGPGRAREQCIRVVYDGSIVPVGLTLAATSSGGLAPYVLLDIERGTGAGFDECDGFAPSELVFSGRLSDLAEGDPLSLGRLLNSGEEVSFRFRFELADDEAALGRSSAADFVWEAVPE